MMRTFKSSLGLSFFMKLFRNFIAIKFLYFTLIVVDNMNWFDVNLLNWFCTNFSIGTITGFYIITSILYLRLVNHNFIFEINKLVIEPSLFKLNSRNELRYDEIKEVVIKHEPDEKGYLILLDLLLFIFIPIEYKWVKIKTKSNKTYKVLCFGIEYDYYDNSDSDQLMEDVFFTFASKKVKVRWTKTSDIYYNNMNKEAQRKLLAS